MWYMIIAAVVLQLVVTIGISFFSLVAGIIVGSVLLFGEIWVFWLSGEKCPQDYRAMILRVGKLVGGVIQPGWFFKPWIPFIKFGGSKIYTAAFFPTEASKLTYETDENHQLRSKERQLLRVFFSLFIELPYNHKDSLRKIVEKKVPLKKEKMLPYFEDIIMPILWRIFIKMGYREAMAIGEDEVKLAELNAKVNELLRASSLLQALGVFGQDPADMNEGSGRVWIEFEKILGSDDLEDAISSQAVNVELAAAAKATAARNSEEVGGQVLGIAARQLGKTLEELEQELKADPAKGKPGGDYYEAINFARAQTARDRAGQQGDLSYIDVVSAGGSVEGGAAMIFASLQAFAKAKGGKPSGKGGGSQSDSKGSQKGGGSKRSADLEEAADLYFTTHQVYPPWDPKKRQPQLGSKP